jgi:hypothetical protein
MLGQFHCLCLSVSPSANERIICCDTTFCNGCGFLHPSSLIDNGQPARLGYPMGGLEDTGWGVGMDDLAVLRMCQLQCGASESPNQHSLLYSQGSKSQSLLRLQERIAGTPSRLSATSIAPCDSTLPPEANATGRAGQSIDNAPGVVVQWMRAA